MKIKSYPLALFPNAQSSRAVLELKLGVRNSKEAFHTGDKDQLFEPEAFVSWSALTMIGTKS